MPKDKRLKNKGSKGKRPNRQSLIRQNTYRKKTKDLKDKRLNKITDIQDKRHTGQKT